MLRGRRLPLWLCCSSPMFLVSRIRNCGREREREREYSMLFYWCALLLIRSSIGFEIKIFLLFVLGSDLIWGRQNALRSMSFSVCAILVFLGCTQDIKLLYCGMSSCLLHIFSSIVHNIRLALFSCFSLDERPPLCFLRSSLTRRMREIDLQMSLKQA
jgi:hypothetical protein